MAIIDPHHALSGQQFELVSVHSARGPAFVVIALPDGRRRSVRRSITDLAGATSTNRSDEALRVSVRTLLPLAQHLAAKITASAQKGIGHGQTRPFAPGGGSSGTLHLNRSRTIPPRPWPSLPPETQTQMAQLLAELLRRMHPRPPIRESADGDHSNLV